MNNNRSATRVLVVDDEESQRTALAGMIGLWGYSVETACDGQEALDKLSSLDIHVIVTDLMMPRMDGRELLTRLKAQGGAPPVIVQTAFGNLETSIWERFGSSKSPFNHPPCVCCWSAPHRSDVWKSMPAVWNAS